jgi:hypothetical protein
MTEGTGQQQPPQWHSNPPSWYNTPPSWINNPPSPPAPPPANTGSGSTADILTALQRMPEQVVNAIREATGQTGQQNQNSGQQNQNSGQQNNGQQTNGGQQNSGQQEQPPRAKTFAERWFDTA